MSDATITFIGAGNMARSLIGGLLADGYPAERIRAADPSEAQRSEIAGRFGIRVDADNAHAVEGADAVVLAVKPQVIRDVAEPLGERLRADGTLVISIAAGVREADLSRWLGGDIAVVRTMPNTPSLVQTGATAQQLVIDLVRPGHPLVAGDFVGAVFGDDDGEVRWCHLGDGNQGPQAHQRTAVAVEHPHLPIRLRQGNTHGKIRGVAHGTSHGWEIQAGIGQF